MRIILNTDELADFKDLLAAMPDGTIIIEHNERGERLKIVSVLVRV